MSYPLLRQRLGMNSYFCDPSSPWQKGAVENTNGRLRRFLPSNMNVAIAPEAYLYLFASAACAAARRAVGTR